MAQRSTGRLQKTTPPTRKRPETAEVPTGFEEGGSLASVGENAAPDTEDHLMPSPQANGGGIVSDDPQDVEPEQPSETELAEQGYPNPEETPDEGMSSTRQEETGMQHAERKMERAHAMMDDKLHSIGENYAAQEALLAEGDDVDFANLPNAPKGDNVMVLGPDEPLRVSGEENGGVIVLDKAVYRAHRPFRSLRWAFTLEFPIGAEVPVSRVRTVPVPEGTEPSSTEETKLQKNDETK